MLDFLKVYLLEVLDIEVKNKTATKKKEEAALKQVGKPVNETENNVEMEEEKSDPEVEKLMEDPMMS